MNLLVKCTQINEFNKPLIEKYRPKNFDDIVFNKFLSKKFNTLIKEGSIPDMILTGEPSTGKTSTALFLANKLFNENNILELNASDDRGLTVIMNTIQPFCKKKSSDLKLIILDEADSMTFDAQFALRRIIEKYSDNTRFCLICNYENKIIKPIKSRCVHIRFYPINENIINDKLKQICNNENIKYTLNGIKTISKLSNGDMRKAINILQSLHSLSDIIKSSICYNTLAIPNTKVTEKITNFLINKDKNFNDTYNIINKYIISEGISISLFLKELYNNIIINKNDIIENIGQDEFIRITIELSKLESKSIISTFSDIYIIGLISIFKKN